MVLFLIRHHLRMSLVAFRRDTEDPEIVREFAALVGTEERLKMLCLMTLADVEAVSPETLTPWKEELLWRLYVDTYNHLTQRYGDELIERNQAGLHELLGGRPAGPRRGGDHRLPRGPAAALPAAVRRATRSTGTSGWRATSTPTRCTSRSSGTTSVWTLTVVTLDKPFLFSNICGVLSSFGMDILRGHAMTNPNGLVLDVFQFTDDERFLELNPDAPRRRCCTCSRTSSPAASDVTARLRGREQSVLQRAGAARSRRSSTPTTRRRGRYTILDIVADNALGLLYRISRVISQHGCDVDLVLIATEGREGDRRVSHHQRRARSSPRRSSAR